MKMSSGSLIAIALLATFHTQDEVFAQTITIVGTTSSQSAFVSSQSAFVSSQSAFVTNSTQQTIAPTASTVTGTESTPTTEPPTTPTSEIPDSNKTCGKLTVTITYADNSQMPSDDKVNATIRGSLFSNSKIYNGVEKTEIEINSETPKQIKVDFKFCLVLKPENAYIEDLAEEQFKTLFNETNIHLTLDASGVKLEWKPVGEECKKCGPSGAGGPFSIKQECTPEDKSCKGLKLDTVKTQDCNKYCPGDSGPVPIVTSFFILPVGLAMFLSFYLWE